MPFHVQLTGPEVDEWGGFFALDLSPEQLEERLLQPYRAGEPITLDGRTVQPNEGLKVKITETENPSSQQKLAAQNRTKRMSRTIGGATLTRWEVGFMGGVPIEQMTSSRGRRAKARTRSSGPIQSSASSGSAGASHAWHTNSRRASEEGRRCRSRTNMTSSTS
jgi:hypothetical protein